MSEENQNTLDAQSENCKAEQECPQDASCNSNLTVIVEIPLKFLIVSGLFIAGALFFRSLRK